MYGKFMGATMVGALVCGGMTLMANAAQLPVPKLQTKLTSGEMNPHNVSGKTFTCPSAEEVSKMRRKGNMNVEFEKNGVLFKGLIQSPSLEESGTAWINLDPADEHVSGIKCTYEYSDGREVAAHVDVDFKGMGVDPKSVTFVGKDEHKVGPNVIMSSDKTEFTIN